MAETFLGGFEVAFGGAVVGVTAQDAFVAHHSGLVEPQLVIGVAQNEPSTVAASRADGFQSQADGLFVTSSLEGQPGERGEPSDSASWCVFSLGEGFGGAAVVSTRHEGLTLGEEIGDAYPRGGGGGIGDLGGSPGSGPRP